MRQIDKIAQDYFDYMGRNYPVMCLSDEFYFFPRAKKGAEFLDRLDSLDQQQIKQSIQHVRKLKNSLERMDFRGAGLEEQIDVRLLNQSMATFLREFAEINIWQMDPTLYLKIILIGCDQLLSRFSFLKQDFKGNLCSRMAQIPQLLNEAKENLKKIPLAYLETALELAEVSIDYFKGATFVLRNKHNVLHALEDFRKFLIERPCHRFFIRDRYILEGILKDSFSYQRNLKEIFEIASDEYRRTLEQLAQIGKEIRPEKSWQQILGPYKIGVQDPDALLGLYAGEVTKLKEFFKKKDIITIPRSQNILIRATPQFMQPIRASASYSSPVTTDHREPAYFYITPGEFSNVHSEYLFVTAHETYPGHHLLDTLRRSLKNPIRRQIESPLFYEGWASYAERLIDESGFIENPMQRMIGLRRQAWRAVRAMLDVGIRINKLKVSDAQQMLLNLGYDLKSVKLMLRHYVLTIGYQLCYTVGKFELERLRRKFAARIGLKKFHDLILNSGQIPFDLLERRINEAQTYVR